MSWTSLVVDNHVIDLDPAPSTPTQHLKKEMATESSLSEPGPTAGAEPASRIATLRSRAFLSDLPDDFLNPGQRATVTSDVHRQGGAHG